MNLYEFNDISKTDAQTFLNHCVQIESWIKTLIENRPYISKSEFLNFATEQAKQWTWQEVLTALKKHPRIGEKKADLELS